MRLAYASDLHGNLAHYQDLLALAVGSQADAVVVGGDLLPHEMRVGEALVTQRRFLETQIRPLLAAFRATYPAIAVLLLQGNDDWAAVAAGLSDLESDGLAFALHGRVAIVGDTPIAGYACVPPTPFSIKDYERPDSGARRSVSFGKAFTSSVDGIRPLGELEFMQRPTISEELELLALQSDPQRTVYVCHTPPANTPLDQMRGERHVGSPALRAFIEAYTPPLTLHGHIHEAPMLSGRFSCRIGPTWCINAGHNGQQLHAVTLDTADIAGTLSHTIFGGYPSREIHHVR